MRYGRGRDCSERESEGSVANAPLGSGTSCRSKHTTELHSVARAIRWPVQVELSLPRSLGVVVDEIVVSVHLRALVLTHRSALERAADPKSRPIYSVLHGLSAGIFRLNFRSLDHEVWSRT